MKKKFLLLATTLLVSSVCLYGCGEDKNNIDTVVEQTEVVEVQDQAENEDVASTGDFASKNYEYNHVFDDIINEAPIIDTDFLQMTSDEQVMAKYGETGYGPDNKQMKYDYDENVFTLVKPYIENDKLNTYLLGPIGKEDFIINQNNCYIDENFNNDSCEYISIMDGREKCVGYPEGTDGNRLVLGHTYSEIIEVFSNKGMLYRMDFNKITVAWCYKDTDTDSVRVTYLSFDPTSQKCVEVGY